MVVAFASLVDGSNTVFASPILQYDRLNTGLNTVLTMDRLFACYYIRNKE